MHVRKIEIPTRFHVKITSYVDTLNQRLL